MDDRRRKRSSCGTQIEDLPSCLIIDIFLGLPTTSLLICRLVCKSWHLFFSNPLFVQLHPARSPSYRICNRIEVKPMKFVSKYFRNLVPGETPEPKANFRVHNPDLTCVTSSSNGLLCFEKWNPPCDVYVCNPILGEYVTIPANRETKGRVESVLGFSSRRNQFKVLQINTPKHTAPYMARIYTIGDGTRQWKSIGTAPSCPFFRFGGFLNGSTHWVDEETHEIFYFNFDSEQFGSLPSPSVPVPGDGKRYATMGVLDECLFFYAGSRKWGSECMEFSIMKECGVEESWTKIFSIDRTKTDQVFSSLYKKLSLLYVNCKIQLGIHGTAYTPSFISLQDVAKGEQFAVIS